MDFLVSFPKKVFSFCSDTNFFENFTNEYPDFITSKGTYKWYLNWTETGVLHIIYYATFSTVLPLVESVQYNENNNKTRKSSAIYSDIVEAFN